MHDGETEQRAERERVGRLLVSSYSRPAGGDGTLATVFTPTVYTTRASSVVPDVVTLSS